MKKRKEANHLTAKEDTPSVPRLSREDIAAIETTLDWMGTFIAHSPQKAAATNKEEQKGKHPKN